MSPGNDHHSSYDDGEYEAELEVRNDRGNVKWLLDNSQEQQVEQAPASGRVRHSSNRIGFQ
jgi:hypothetical protein